MANNMDKEIGIAVRPSNESSKSSISVPSLKSPRTPRFAEATSFNSPIDPPATSKSAFPEHQSQYLAPQAQPGDVGFGYIGQRDSVPGQAVEMPMTPRSPLKSALRSPGAAPRKIEQNPLSPTWIEEEKFEKEELSTEKEQAKDLRVKTRVRIAKMALRCTNFSCSLIVLAMITTTLSIFRATRALPPRNGLPAWHAQSIQWPNILLLTIACVSLVAAVIVFYAYWKGGHKKAEKAALYYTMFAVGFFVLSIIMWAIGAAALQSSRANHKQSGQDIWGWSCKDNPRKTIFENDVNFELVCRLQNWSLVCCIIEVVVEVITIMIYGIVFYRFYSKRRLRKSMAKRDTARSEMYMAQLRAQSQLGTPGTARFGPDTPRGGGYNPLFSPRYVEKSHADDINEAEEGTRYVTAPAAPQQSPSFKLQTPPPKKNTPKLNQDGFESPPQVPTVTPATPPPMTPLRSESELVHHAAAPGEQQYASVPIPGAYAGAINSPTHPPNTAMAQHFAPLR